MCKYEVECKCGHVGRKNYIVIGFAIIAENGKEAASIARNIPRVKHDHKDAILNVRKINDEEFDEICERNDNDLYLRCNNKQEQRILDLTSRLHKEERYLDHEEIDQERKHIFFKKKPIRNPKRFFKNIDINYQGMEGKLC